MGFRPPSGVGGVSGTASVRLRGGSGTWGAEPSARLRTGVATGVGVSTLAVPASTFTSTAKKTHPLQVHTTLQALLDHTRTIKYIEMLLRHERKPSTRQRRRNMYLLTMVNKCMLLLIHLITKQ